MTDDAREWGAYPSRSLWYGEVICGSPSGDETDYFCGYSDDPVCPDVELLVPVGWTLLESVTAPTPRNPEWQPPEGEGED